MAVCDNCEADVLHVWKHRKPNESLTDRTGKWLCAGCHPKMTTVFADGYC